MPALSSPTLWRAKPYGSIGYLFLLKPTVIGQARVNMTVNDDTYPVAAVDYDTVTTGSYTDWKAGMTVLFGTTAGADDLGRNRLRQNATASRLRIALSARGRNDGEVDLVDNAYITILDDFRIWWKPPRYEADGTEYKDYRVKVGTYNEESLPVANGGVGYAGSYNVVQFDSSESFATAPGATISSRSWDMGSGATYTSGTSTSTSPIVEFTPGFRWVKLTVTDTNGKSHMTRIPVYIDGEGSGQTTISDFIVTNRSLRTDGQEIGFLIKEAIDLDDYPDGTLVMYWEDEFYGDDQLSLGGPAGRGHMKFIGWMDSERTRIDELRQTTEITCIDAGGRLRKIPGFPQIVAHKDSAPSGWSEMVDLNVDRYMHYLLQWHTTALNVTPFTWSGQGDTYVAKALDSNEGTPWDQVNEIAEAFCHRLTCDSRGQLKVKPDPLLLDTGDRTSVEYVTLDEDDYVELDYEYNRAPRVGWLDAAAVKARTDKYKAILVQAPGEIPGQGPEQVNINHRLVVNAAEMRIQEGHRYARLNSLFSKPRFRLLHPGDGGIEPAEMEWLRVQITDFAGVRGRTANVRTLVEEISWTYNHDTGKKECYVTCEIETEGTPAEIYREPSDTPNTTDNDDIIFMPNEPIDSAAGVALVFHETGYVFRTLNFDDASPTWAEIYDIGEGAASLFQFEEDPFSPYYLGTGERVDGWMLSKTKLYRVTDILGAFNVSTAYTFLSASQQRVMSVSKLTQNHIVVLSGDNPTRVTYTTDGTTFNNVTLIAADIYGSVNWKLGIQCSEITEGKVFAVATDSAGSPTEIRGYKSISYGATWSAINLVTDKLYLKSTYTSTAGTMIFNVPKEGNKNERIAYFGRIASSTAYLIRSNGNESPYEEDITPIVSSNRYGADPYRTRTFSVAPDESDIVAIVGVDYSGGGTLPDLIDGDRGVFYSEDAGTTWTTVVSPSSSVDYRACKLYSDGTLLLWGRDCAVAISAAGGTPVSKIGNLAGLAHANNNDGVLADAWRKR
jgi:hypothetical protein